MTVLVISGINSPRIEGGRWQEHPDKNATIHGSKSGSNLPGIEGQLNPDGLIPRGAGKGQGQDK
jgi:hypothetical protein